MTTPTPEEAAAAVQQARQAATQHWAVRDLAIEIGKQARLGFDPMTKRKGIITAVSAATTPPTISVQISGDTTVTIDGVRFEDTYSPRVGTTVLLEKQGADLLAVGHVADLAGAAAGGWTTASLTSGWAHNGNNMGDVQYRRVMDHGSWKMQWRGGVDVGSGTAVLSTALATDFRPSSVRPILAARDATGAVAVRLDFTTSGTVTVVGGTTGPNSGGSGFTSLVDLSNSTGDGYGNGDLNPHTHPIAFADHDHSIPSHSHSVTAPSWISFNGIEYFL
ncbi:hypothetical protein [Streptomyces sp. NPDC015131]|uniref:hypothetical protein n=1 Tax=Streptomyces sp. NPDC015131 TaxID=3364941 RepID=UPI0036FA4197